MPTDNSDSALSAVIQAADDVSSAQNILLNQELDENVLTSEGNSNPNDLGKLTAQDLEDLEKISAELDCLARNLPNAVSEASMAVNISNMTEEVITSDTTNYLDHVSYTSLSEPISSETVMSQPDSVGVGEDSFVIQDHVEDQVTVVTEEVETETLMEPQTIETEMENIDETQYQIVHVNDANEPNSVISSTSYVVESSQSIVSTTPSIPSQAIPEVTAIKSILPVTTGVETAALTRVSIPQTKIAGAAPLNIANFQLARMVGSPKILTTTSNLNFPTKVIGTIAGNNPASVLGFQSANQNAPLTILNTSGMKFGGKQVMFIQKPLASSTTGASILTSGTKIISSTGSIAGKSTVTTTIVPDTKISSTGSKKPAPLLVPVTIAQNQSPAGGTQTLQIPMSLANFKGDTPIKVIMSQNSKGGGGPMQISTSTMNLLQSLAGGGKNMITTMAGGQFMNKTVKIVQAPSGTQFASSASGGTTISGGNIITLANQGGTQKVGGQQPTILLASPNKTVTGFKGNPQFIRAFTGNPNSKQSVVLLSPVKGKPGTFQNLTLKSPQKIAPAPNTLPSGARFAIVSAPQATGVTASTTVTSGGIKQQQKVILRPIVPVAKPGSTIASSTATTTTTQPKQIMVPVSRVLTSSNSGVQPIQVPGNKFNYVRLVSAPLNQGASTSKTAGIPTSAKTATLVPVSSMRTPTNQQGVTLATTSGGNQLRFALNVTRPATTGNQRPSSKVNLQQRIIVPSNTTKISSSQLQGLPPGSIIQTTNSATGQPSFVMVSAQYMAQLQQSQNSGTGNKILPVLQPARTVMQASGSANNFIPIASAAPTTPVPNFDQTSGQNANIVPSHVITTMRQMNGRAPPPELDNRPRKPCNCTKSQCLKLYCDCFANGEFCNNCNCTNCANNLEKENDRQKAIKSCLDRNPMAFHPKIGKTRKGKDGDHERSHTKGCNCKRSGCLKNYCECYEAKILCTNLCRCSGCKNFEDSNERKTLMHLADAAEVRVQQQLAAKDKISSQLLDLPTRAPIISLTGERLPFSFVTQEVTEATCNCLLARAEEAERSEIAIAVLEKEILEEFGRCLKQIIDSSNKTRSS